MAIQIQYFYVRRPLYNRIVALYLGYFGIEHSLLLQKSAVCLFLCILYDFAMCLPHPAYFSKTEINQAFQPWFVFPVFQQAPLHI